MSLNYRGDIVWLLGYPAYLAHDDPEGSINQKSDLTRDELLSYLNDHIETVFGRYKGKFESIYVVNEPLETRYNETIWEPLPTEMRHSFWYDNIGPDYIEYAFNKTHEVDPDAKLFINEGLWWGVNSTIAADRRDVFYNLVVSLLKKGVPIHGIGLQYYFDVPTRYPWVQSIDWDQIHDEIELFHNLSLEIHLSEVGMPIIGEVTQEKLQNQSLLYRKLVDLALEFENVTLLNTWGVADDHSYFWTPADSSAPLLFDSNYNPKPAYYAIKERLVGVTSIYQHNFSDPSINFDHAPPRDYGWAIDAPFKIQYEIKTANQSGTGVWKLSDGNQVLGELKPGDKFWVEFSRLNGDYGTRLYWNASDYMDVKIYGDGFYSVYKADYSVYDAGFFVQHVPFPYMPEWIRHVPKNPPGRIKWEDLMEMFYTHSYYSYKDPDMEIMNNYTSYGFRVENGNYSFQQIWNKTTGILEYYHRNHMNDANFDLDVEFSICDSIITNKTLPEHDVAVADVSPSKSVICQNYTIPIQVTVENQGDYTETFNATIYANMTAVETREITLTKGSSTTLTFTLNTTSFDKGRYTLRAIADTVLGETDTEDNICHYGTITVAMVGDIVPDGIVDIFDITYVALSFGTEYGKITPPGTQPYQPNADINSDGQVNILDLYIVARNFGKKLNP
jgi:GH35 family endo-1,4-beta-xylanase